jgi:hypothetical protein
MTTTPTNPDLYFDTTPVPSKTDIDFDQVDDHMRELYAHYVLPQHGAATNAEMLALTVPVMAMCGYTYRPTFVPPPGTPPCPRCAYQLVLMSEQMVRISNDKPGR